MGRPGDHRDLVLRDGPHHVVRGELGKQRNGAAAGKGDQAEGAVARRKGHRGGAAQDFTGGHLIDVLGDYLGLEVNFLDKVDAALGLAGGAGGEQDHPDVEGSIMTLANWSLAVAMALPKDDRPWLPLLRACRPPPGLWCRTGTHAWRFPPPPSGGS